MVKKSVKSAEHWKIYQILRFFMKFIENFEIYHFYHNLSKMVNLPIFKVHLH